MTPRQGATYLDGIKAKPIETQLLRHPWAPILNISPHFGMRIVHYGIGVSAFATGYAWLTWAVRKASQQHQDGAREHTISVHEKI
jgi:hypothetical protein